MEIEAAKNEQLKIAHTETNILARICKPQREEMGDSEAEDL